MLSGFILMYNYGARFTVGLAGEQVRAFYVARFARVYPLHLLTFLIAAALFAPLQLSDRTLFPFPPAAPTVANTTAQLTLLQSWSPNPKFFSSFNTVSWTISDEAFFYAAFPLIAALVMRSRLPVLRTVTLALAVVWIAVVYAIWTLGSKNGVASGFWLYQIFPLFRLFDFFAGVSLGAMLMKAATVKRGLAAGTVMECFALLGVGVTVAIVPAIGDAFKYSLWFLPCFSFIIYTFARGEGRLAQLLSLPALVYLGELSFAFYMLHELIVRFWYWKMGLSLPWFGLVACFAATLALSALVFHAVESPMRTWLRSQLGPKPQLHPALAPND